MTEWEFRSKWRRRLFMRLVGPVIGRMYGQLSCMVVCRVGLLVVGAHRPVGRHARRSVTAHVRCP